LNFFGSIVILLVNILLILIFMNRFIMFQFYYFIIELFLVLMINWFIFIQLTLSYTSLFRWLIDRSYNIYIYIYIIILLLLLLIIWVFFFLIIFTYYFNSWLLFNCIFWRVFCSPSIFNYLSAISIFIL